MGGTWAQWNLSGTKIKADKELWLGNVLDMNLSI